MPGGGASSPKLVFGLLGNQQSQLAEIRVMYTRTSTVAVEQSPVETSGEGNDSQPGTRRLLDSERIDRRR